MRRRHADGCEPKLDSDLHCGECHNACANQFANATGTCQDEACHISACDQLYEDCENGEADGCETRTDTLDDCNGCGVACNKASCAGEVCTAADCALPQYADDCGSGKCGNCDGNDANCEAQLDNDLNNCGTCGNACAFNQGLTPATAHATLTCSPQGCRAVCAAGYGDCNSDYRDGCERQLNTLQNCDACGQTCAIPNATATCGTFSGWPLPVPGRDLHG